MSEFNIPIIEPTIDYTQVPPINQKRTIAFVNHFITHIATYLNKFALSAEEKLFEFEYKIQKVEAALAILESKLSSIPELQNWEETQNNEAKNSKTEDQTIPVEVVTQRIDEPDNIQTAESDNDQTAESDNVQTAESDNTKTSEPEKSSATEPEIEKTETQPISSDPKYIKYFKMMHFGVPKQAVKLKMEQDGLDSSVLDNPNQRVPKSKSADLDENADS